MPNWFAPKFNTGSVLPEIETLLKRFDYQGLTDPDDPINSVAKDIMADDYYRDARGSVYTNIYGFQAAGRQYFLCDRAMTARVETRRHVGLLAANKYFPVGFEITTDEYFINNDCDSVEIIGECDIRLEKPDQYEACKNQLASLLPHCEQFGTNASPVSFFCFPEDHILGYHVSGRLIEPDELGSAIALMERFP